MLVLGIDSLCKGAPAKVTLISTDFNSTSYKRVPTTLIPSLTPLAGEVFKVTDETVIF